MHALLKSASTNPVFTGAVAPYLLLDDELTGPPVGHRGVVAAVEMLCVGIGISFDEP